MRLRKTKAKIGRKEPYLCKNHDKRTAEVMKTILGADVDLCWVCWIEALLKETPASWLLQSKLLRWLNHYEALGQ